MKNKLTNYVKTLFFLFLCLSLSTNIYSSNKYVDASANPDVADGTYDFPYADIQLAVDAAADFDTVFVVDGYYILATEINLEGKKIVMAGSGYYCSIDAELSGVAFRLDGGEDNSTIISGFNIYTSTGDGIDLASDASPQILNCYFDCPYAIYATGSNEPIVERNIFNNAEVAISLNNATSLTRIVNNTFYGTYSGSSVCVDIQNGNPHITNNIMVNFDADVNVNVSGSPTVQYNIRMADLLYADAPNFDTDPMLRGDYTPMFSSPAIDAGGAEGLPADPDGSVTDIGALPYTHLSPNFTSVGNPTCSYSDNGYILLSVLGGGSTKTITSSGFGDEVNDGYYYYLTGGTYTFSVVDEEGATAVFTQTLTAPPAITNDSILITADTDSTLTGTGTLTPYFSGGTGTLYFYLYVNGSEPFISLNSGNDTLLISDDNACSGIVPLYIPLDAEASCSGSISHMVKDEKLGEVELYITLQNADSAIIDYGDGSDYDIITTSQNIVHYYPLGSYFTPNLTIYDPCYVYYADDEFILKDTSCGAYLNSYNTDSLKAQLNFSYDNYLDTMATFNLVWYDKESHTQKDVPVYAETSFPIKQDFPKAGYYAYTVTVTGTFCNSVINDSAYIYGISDCAEPTFTPIAKDSVNYNFTISSIQDNTIYTWYFGDASDYENGTSVTHAFEMDNGYFIEVWSEDTVNICYNYFYDYIQVGNVGCYAWLGYDADSINANQINFSNYSSEGKYYWDFGDGDISTEFTPSHEYKDPGVYTVCLTVTDSTGSCLKKECEEIVVGQINCRADFSVKTEDDGTVSFTNMSSGESDSYYWYFGDWDESYDENPEHVFAEAGIYTVYLAVYNSVSGCYSEIEKEVQVGNITDITFAKFSYYVDGMDLVLSNESSDNTTDWYWTLGDGTYSTDRDGVISYEYAGVYEICLTVLNPETGASDSKCEEILIGESDCNTVADFNYMFDKTTENTVRFYNKSEGDYDFLYWDLGDGTASNDTNVMHTYGKSGFYFVTLSVKKWDTDCSDFFADYIQVGDVSCRSDFEYMVDAPNKKITLTNTSKVTDGNYFWYFDDGDYSVDKDPVKTFDIPGLHYISLTVTDGEGICMDYMEKAIQIGEINCSAQFSYYVDKETNKAFCKNEAKGKGTEFYWTFGDGAEETDKNPVHQFKYPGYYTISLNTFDPETWCMDYFEQVILIGDEGKDCEADFMYMVDNTTSTVRFNDKSKGDIDGYVWNFGDGIISQEANTSHKYNQGGFYEVCLTVVNKKGISNISCDWVQVSSSAATDCQAKFAYTVDSAKLTGKFVDKSYGTITNRKWDFGDNTNTLNKTSQEHIYAAAGYYLVSLRAGNDAGCSSVAYQLVNISKPDTGLMVQFGYDPKKFNKKAGGYPVDFVGAGLGDQARLRWNFGDTTSNSNVDTTSNRPNHVYSTPGEYEVCLTFDDPVTGQTATSCKKVTTEELCASDIYKPEAKCKDITIKLNAQKIVDIEAAAIDNGSNDPCGLKPLDVSQTHFSDADLGIKKVTLTVTDIAGNTNTCESNVTIQNDISIDFLTSKLGVSTFPNPFSNELTVSYKLTENTSLTISVCDMLGKEINTISLRNMNAGLQKTNLNTEGLSAGTYVVKVKLANGSVSKQVVVKR